MGKLLQDLSTMVSNDSSLPNVRANQGKLDPLNAKLEDNLLPGFKGLSMKPTGAPAGASVPPQTLPATLITPTEMPNINGPDQRDAKRRSVAQALSRGGRASTILTNPDSLG